MTFFSSGRALLARPMVLAVLLSFQASAATDLDPERFVDLRHGSAAYPRASRPNYTPFAPGLSRVTTAHGDFNCDGVADLAHGFGGGDVNGLVNAGFVSIVFGDVLEGFKSTGQLLTQGGSNAEGANERDDGFGSSLATINYDHDACHGDLLVGTPGEDVPQGSNAGVVYPFRSTSTGLNGSGEPRLPLSVAEFGWSANDQVGANVVAGTLRDRSIFVTTSHNNSHDFFTWRRADGASTFTAVENLGFQNLGAAAVGDFNGDGNDDLFGLNYNVLPIPANTVRVFFHDGQGRITGEENIEARHAGASIYWAQLKKMGVGDFDGDRKDDLVVLSADRNAYVLYGSSVGFLNSSGNLVRSPDVLRSPVDHDGFGAGMTTGDFNGDGFADVAIGDITAAASEQGTDGMVHVFFGAATGLDTTRRHLLRSPISGQNVMYGAWGLEAGDYNDDGVDDLAIMHRGTAQDQDGMRVFFSWSHVTLQVTGPGQAVEPGLPVTFSVRASRVGTSRFPLARGSVRVSVSGSTCDIPSLNTLGLGSCTLQAPTTPGRHIVAARFNGALGYRDDLDTDRLTVSAADLIFRNGFEITP